MDVAVGLLALIFFVAIKALTALAIKLDSEGPVFFAQNRRGSNGRNFLMLNSEQ
jgi:undecaprenyl-phosphate galactose phosphotransferase/putative colanic acid biosynthesis UDP-glucose lipid carrier transferase